MMGDTGATSYDRRPPPDNDYRGREERAVMAEKMSRGGGGSVRAPIGYHKQMVKKKMNNKKGTNKVNK